MDMKASFVTGNIPTHYPLHKVSGLDINIHDNFKNIS